MFIYHICVLYIWTVHATVPVWDQKTTFWDWCSPPVRGIQKLNSGPQTQQQAPTPKSHLVSHNSIVKEYSWHTTYRVPQQSSPAPIFTTVRPTVKFLFLSFSILSLHALTYLLVLMNSVSYLSRYKVFVLELWFCNSTKWQGHRKADPALPNQYILIFKNRLWDVTINLFTFGWKTKTDRFYSLVYTARISYWFEGRRLN